MRRLEGVHGVSQAIAWDKHLPVGQGLENALVRNPWHATENGRFKDAVRIGNLDTYRKALPLLNALVSPDLHTFGIVVNIDESAMFGKEIGSMLKNIGRIVERNVPGNAAFRITGGSGIA